MPPPLACLGTRGTMVSGCPSEARNSLSLPGHGSIAPSDQPWPFCGMSVCPSVRRGFWAFPGEPMDRMARNFTFWCIGHLQNWLVYGHSLSLLFFSIFGTIFTLWNGLNLRFPGISRRTHGWNGLKCHMLVYPYHLQNWLDCGHGMLIFLILALCSLSETGQTWCFWAFPRECMDEMAWNFTCSCILTIFRTD